MMLQPATIGRADAYWQRFLGCSAAAFAASQTLVVPHAGLGDYWGVFLFRRAGTLIVSVPHDVGAAQRSRLAALAPTAWETAPQLVGAVDQVIGPAFVGYADEATFTPQPGGAARLLGPADHAAYAALRAACPPLAWEHGGSEFGARPLAGAFVGEQLAALAGYELWGDAIAHIAVVADPAWRGRGYGRAAVSLLTETVLRAGLVPQYRTLERNAPSLQIAAQLGFVGYARSLAVRLR